MAAATPTPFGTAWQFGGVFRKTTANSEVLKPPLEVFFWGGRARLARRRRRRRRWRRRRSMSNLGHDGGGYTMATATPTPPSRVAVRSKTVQGRLTSTPKRRLGERVALRRPGCIADAAIHPPTGATPWLPPFRRPPSRDAVSSKTALGRPKSTSKMHPGERVGVPSPKLTADAAMHPPTGPTPRLPPFRRPFPRCRQHQDGRLDDLDDDDDDDDDDHSDGDGDDDAHADELSIAAIAT